MLKKKLEKEIKCIKDIKKCNKHKNQPTVVM